jgi:hypothetical protein
MMNLAKWYTDNVIPLLPPVDLLDAFITGKCAIFLNGIGSILGGYQNLPFDQLISYQGRNPRPADFESFWEK